MPKPTDNLMGAYLQKLLRDWLAEHPGSTEVDFAKIAGLSKATINNVKNKGAGAGSKTVQGFARVLGVPPSRLHADAEEVANPRPAGVSTMADLSDWPRLVASLKASPLGNRFSSRAWEQAAHTSSLFMPKNLDEIDILQLLHFWERVVLKRSTKEALFQPSEQTHEEPMHSALTAEGYREVGLHELTQELKAEQKPRKRERRA